MGVHMISLQSQDMDIRLLVKCPCNVRRYPGDVTNLAASIKAVGVLQPLLVRPAPDSKHYEVVAGFRRWKACELLGSRTIPAVVRELTDCQALTVSLTENVQQQTLDPIERAEGVRRLVDYFAQEMPRGEALERVGKEIGKAPPTLNEWLALLRTTEAVQQMVREKQVAPRVAARIATLPKERQESVARAMVAESLTRDDALRVVQIAQAQPARPVEQVVAEVRDRVLEEVSVSISFPGGLYGALVQKTGEERTGSIQETIRRACRAYTGYDAD
jgi:ParB family chromosome partitioning protein